MKDKRIITPIILTLLGITLLLIPGTILTTVIEIFGAIVIISSLFYIISSLKDKKPLDLFYGISVVLLGVILIIFPEGIASIIPLILGLWIIAKSMFKLQFISVLKATNSGYYIKAFILNIIMLIMGIILVFNPFKGAELFLRIMGIYILVYAILDIIDFILSKPKKVKVIK